MRDRVEENAFMTSPRLGVNIDHAATLRQSRYAATPGAANVEPEIVAIASACERAGAAGITVHLRADRRHIQDRDVERLRGSIITKLNLEMGNTPEIVDIALKIVPDEVCLVPENRAELTTEGGLDAMGNIESLRPTIDRLQKAGVRVSLFIDPDPAQIAAAKELGAEIIELHTGAFANATGRGQDRELARLQDAAMHAHAEGLQVNAGHGINYTNVKRVRGIPYLAEVNIGHSIISRAVFVGIDTAVREMRALLGSK
jgi:pyridoxine 5-phosphate synthase